MISNELNKNVSINTKLIVLFVASFQIVSLFLGKDSAEMTVVILYSLIAVLLVDYYFLFKGPFKKLWSTLKWLVLGIVILLVIIGFINN